MCALMRRCTTPIKQSGKKGCAVSLNTYDLSAGLFVRGLTNAYQWTDPEGAYAKGDPPGAGRKFTYKTLQLNFWRPGDEIQQNEREIRFGVAPDRASLYESGEGVAYRWVYR